MQTTRRFYSAGEFFSSPKINFFKPDPAGRLSRLGLAFETSCAQTFGDCPSPFHHSRFLDVDAPDTSCRLLGPGTVVSKLRAFSTLLTLGHDFPPFLRNPSPPSIGKAQAFFAKIDLIS
jgi:hypothetical protein